ncbi:MAG: PD-(D/E)XK nuclease family protein [Acidobacteria bacterium]|nr:MAG: PD-(D/E)XK nuclease family protein [Acidobacteriota bacterium]PYY05004.1 MAG: PD-(D/E)XK nuclease family protein [Acidobacteriota bacterium]
MLTVLRVFESGCAAERLDAARDFLSGFAASTEVIVVGNSRDAADDLVRDLSMGSTATFGFHRFSVMQLAVRFAAVEMARRGLAPSTVLGTEALAARVAFEVIERGELRYFAPVAARPGFAPALAASMRELRACGVAEDALEQLGDAGVDLARLLREFETQLSSIGLADRPALFEMAMHAVESRTDALVGASVLLLDVAIDARRERDFIASLCSCAPRALATVPAGDERTLSALEKIQSERSTAPHKFENSLERLQNYVFVDLPSDSYPKDGQVRLFSAPGEGRECVEIARRLLEEAKNGVVFDQIAILVRTPGTYAPLLEAALGRAGIPAYFARGTSRPDPAGRAFVVLLACAVEGFSAKRFAEYLSLGQVPLLTEEGTPPRDRAVWSPATDEAIPSPPGMGMPTESEGASEHRRDSDAEPVVAGTLRTPRRWEELLVEAAVVGGKERWARRLDGLAAELRLKITGLEKVEPESPRLIALDRQLVNLEHLRRFALPIIEELAALPRHANWGEWLAALERLAPMALRHPERVLSVLAELKPMATIGPVALDEVRQVLANRLTHLEVEPSRRRFGCVFIGTPEQARGRSFDTVFVPGLAERIFPQKLREDPILHDDLRRSLSTADPPLMTRSDHAAEERLWLRLAAGAARRQMVFSYPRVEVALARPRVPSFYALDVTRTTLGHLPNVDVFEREAAEQSNALLAWPAPVDPLDAIDDMEHDLATLRPLLQAKPEDVSGRARYLMELNPNLARSLRSRWQRWHRPWTSADGLCQATAASQAALADHRLNARPYSPTALQLFAACPYRFLLSAIYRLAPREEPVPVESIDPMTRGAIFHRVQAQFVRQALKRHWLPLTPARLQDAQALVDGIVDKVAAEFSEQLVPAIERVWEDEISQMRGDFRGWLLRLTEQGDWSPVLVEFAFGLWVNDGYDPASTADPVELADGFLLRGIIDLAEQNTSGALRVIDYKTGKDRTEDSVVVGHGELLQPVLYSLAIESIRKQSVAEARLWYCTATGGYSERVVPINEATRSCGHEVLHIINHSIEEGFLPPAPKERACRWCDFRAVCGPYEELRASRKDQKPLAALFRLREMP